MRVTMCRVLFLITISGILPKYSMEYMKLFEVTEPSVQTSVSFSEVSVTFINYLDVSESDAYKYEVQLCFEITMDDNFNPDVFKCNHCVSPETGNNKDHYTSITINGLDHNTVYYLWLLLKQDYSNCDACSQGVRCTEDCGCILDRTSSFEVTTADLPWRTMSGGQFFFSSDADTYLNFVSAREFCEEERSELISITSSAENTSVSQVLHNGGYCWIGLAFHTNVPIDNCSHCPDCVDGESDSNDCQLCDNCRNQWYWVDRTPLDHVNWGKGQPNENQSCAVVWNGHWYDSDCSQQHCFICHKAGVTTAPTSYISSTTPFSTTTPSDWKIATITVSVALGLLLVAVLVLLGCLYKAKTELKAKVFPGKDGIYKDASGKYVDTVTTF